MDIASFVVGIVVGLVIASLWATFRQVVQVRSAMRDRKLTEHAKFNDEIAEADSFVAYGSFDEAAKLLITATNNEPRRNDFKLKLLQVYFVQGDANQFLATAKRFLPVLGNTPDWAQVTAMGKQLCPEEPIFHAVPGGAA